MPDLIFYGASTAADFSIAWHAISATMAAVSPSRRHHAYRLAVALGIESFVVNQVLKRVLKRARPDGDGNRTYLVRRPKTGSFPSGHSSSATLAAVLLTDAMPKLRPVWAVMATTVAASRVYNRMHHPSDVASGMAIGWAFGVAARRLAGGRSLR